MQWAELAEASGAGEILLTSMDADGTKDGFDTEMLRLIRASVGVPLIASGGAGALEHFPEAIAAGADAVLAASVFHFGQLRIDAVKRELAEAGYPVRELAAPGRPCERATKSSDPDGRVFGSTTPGWSARSCSSTTPRRC